MLRDTLVFGIKSDKVRRDAITIGNDLTYQQVNDLAKTEKSTAAQMDIIAGSESSPQVHAVRSRRGPQSYRSFNQKKSEDGKKQLNHKRRKLLINRATSVEMNTQKVAVQPNMPRATFARKLAITRKFVARNCVKSTRLPKTIYQMI